MLNLGRPISSILRRARALSLLPPIAAPESGGAQAQKQRTQGPGPGPGAGGSNGAGRQRAKGAVDVDGDARQKVIDLYRSGQRVKKQREKQARMAQRS